MVNRATIITARKPTERALADWRTIFAARSGVRSFRWAEGGAEKRSAGTGADDGRGAGWRSSGGRPVWLVIGLLDGAAYGSWQDQMQPVGVSGGMIPGWPTAMGSGPRVILPVLTVRTPSASTVAEKRSMLRGAGPYCGPSALIPRRS